MKKPAYAFIFIFSILVFQHQTHACQPITRANLEPPSFWPLTVERGFIHCLNLPAGSPVATFITEDGTEYALNGIAILHGYPDIRPIWQYDLQSENTDTDPKIPITGLIKAALKTCPGRKAAQ